MIRALRRWFRKDHYYKPGEQFAIVLCFTLIAGCVAWICVAMAYGISLPF